MGWGVWVRGLMLRRVAVVGLAVGVLSSIVPSQAVASSSDTYDQLQRQIAHTRTMIREAKRREKRIMSELSASDQRRQSLERSLALVTDQLVLASRRLDALQQQAGLAALELQAKNLELAQATDALDDFVAKMHDRAANIYIRGADAYSAVLVGSDNFHEYVAGMAYAESVLNTDVNLVDQLRDLKDAIESQRSAVEARRKLLEKQSDLVAAQQAQLASLRNQQSSARVAVLTEMNYKERLLRHVRSEKRAYGEALQSMLAQSRSIEGLLRRAQRGQRVVQGYGGYLKWPVSGRISSPYGWRTHPIYGYRSFHTGIDIAAPYGTTVKAARAGEVLYVGTRDAYGLIVIVDHGNSLATVYAHLSKAYVHAGQSLRTLGSLGAVGCSGWCTGPHLHFEVRVSGSPVNPMGWL
jgi:murein DD-endopeptidase MepM/ murein hydrolase activator NlpD